MALEVVSFDFGGTLVYETNKEYVVYHDIFERLGLDVDINEVESAIQKAKGWWKEQEKQGKIWNSKILAKYIEHVAMYLKIDGTPNLVKRVDELWLERGGLKAYDDVEPAIKELRQMGYRLIVISNVTSLKSLSIHLSKVNLNTYFELLAASGSVGFEKPNKGLFLWASRAIGVDPARIVHIGDDLEADYLGAIASRFKAILVDRSGKNADRSAIRVRSLTEVPQIITTM